ncbi:MAG: hypothetical protein JW971_02810 [Synergistales bacterium]|nr:hypothetical protein [Synergistales bacterium]
MIRKGSTGLFLATGYGDALTEKESLIKVFTQCGLGNRDMISFPSAVLDGYVIYGETWELKDNAVLPVCCTCLTSDSPGTIISACIGMGLPLDPGKSALLETFSGFCSPEEAVLEVEKLLKNSSEQRNMDLKDLRFKCVEHKVANFGAVAALCPFFRKEMELNGSMA